MKEKTGVSKGYRLGWNIKDKRILKSRCQAIFIKHEDGK